jgi:hypothetical protein
MTCARLIATPWLLLILFMVGFATWPGLSGEEFDPPIAPPAPPVPPAPAEEADADQGLALPLSLPLPESDWSPHPLATLATDERIQAGDDLHSWHLGPFAWSDKRQVHLIEDGGTWRARIDGDPPRQVAVQVLFRRLVIGPTGPELLDVPTRTDGRDEYRWLLLRDGSLVQVPHLGQPRFFEDELEFDVAFDRLELATLDEDQRRRWITAYRRRQARLLAEAAYRASAPASDDGGE